MYGNKGLGDHSKAKLELYREYLATYLRVISSAKNTNTIHIFDLFCGEGQYADDQGSPLVLYNVLKDFISSNKESINVHLIFNDSKKRKIAKVATLLNKRPGLPNCKIDFYNSDFRTLLPIILSILTRLKNEKCLIFLDPCGYKDIFSDDIRRLLDGGKTEIIWFIPISFIYRFAGHASESTDPSHLPLQNILSDYFANSFPSFSNQRDFISKLLDRFRNSFPGYFVDTFTIERDTNSLFGLFFFTSHIRGFEKMLEAKWAVDEREGRGFRFDYNVGNLFSPLEISDFPEKVECYIKLNAACTNKDLYEPETCVKMKK